MQQESKAHRLWTLFSSMLLISTFTFGGGFVIVSLMKKKFVDELHYLTEEEMLDMTALAQTAPGAIAVNGAILVGRRIAGIPGLIVAALATILPPIVIISIISMMYAAFAENEWVRGADGDAVGRGGHLRRDGKSCGKVVQSKDWLNLLLMAGAFVASAVFHINVIVVILVAAAIGVVRALLARKGGVSA
ncbi:MAG: chromate transporter [Christensenellales bacterium]